MFKNYYVFLIVGGGSYQMFALRVRLFANGMPLLS